MIDPYDHHYPTNAELDALREKLQDAQKFAASIGLTYNEWRQRLSDELRTLRELQDFEKPLHDKWLREAGHVV